MKITYYLCVMIFALATIPLEAMRPGFLNQSPGARAEAAPQDVPAASDRSQGIMSADTEGQILQFDLDDPVPTIPHEPRSIHIVAMHGDLDRILKYIQRGATIDIQDKHGNTPLMYAIIHKQGAAAILLLRQGANPNTQNKLGMTPLNLALEVKLESVIAALKERGGEKSDLPDNAFKRITITSRTIKSIELLTPSLQKEWETLYDALMKDKESMDNLCALVSFAREHNIPYYEQPTNKN